MDVLGEGDGGPTDTRKEQEVCWAGTCLPLGPVSTACALPTTAQQAAMATPLQRDTDPGAPRLSGYTLRPP